MTSRLYPSIALLAWSALSLFAQEQTNEPMNVILDAESRYGARIGIEVVRCRDWQTLYCNREDELMTPASLVKVVSTGAALRARGTDYKFPTYIYLDGKQSGSILKGNVLIEGGGDPSIGSRLIPQDSVRIFDEVVQALRSRGIQTVDGDIVVLSGHRELGVHPSWMLEDIGEYYGAGLYGVNYADNTLNLWVGARRQGKRTYATLESDPANEVKWINKLRIGKHTSTLVNLTPTSPEVYVTGSISPRTTRVNLRPANPIPANYFGNKLVEALSQANIQVKGKAQANYEVKPRVNRDQLLHTYYSKSLDTLSVITNHRSQNLYAEAISSLLSTDRESRGEALTSFWQRRLSLPKGSLSLVDGSGLSRMNKITPSALSRILIDLMGGFEPHDGALVETLPQVGVDGTVKRLMQAEEITAYLKSGSMKGILGYAGYVEHNGEWYILVYMTEGFPAGSMARQTLRRFLSEAFPV